MNTTIILIDDDEITLFLHTRILRNCGLTGSLVSFNSGIEALDYINAHSHPVQQFIILLDINMPVMNGWQVLAVLEKLPIQEQIEVFVVSSSIDLADINKAQSMDIVSKVVKKPITTEICNEIKARLKE